MKKMTTVQAKAAAMQTERNWKDFIAAKNAGDAAGIEAAKIAERQWAARHDAPVGSAALWI